MEPERPRERVGISTLMLLVVIAAMAAALVVRQMKWQEAERTAPSAVNGARLVAQEARLAAEQARAQAAQAQAELRKALDEAKGGGRRGE
jgi:sensor histidine kinase regulating citrate/malate metabolism